MKKTKIIATIYNLELKGKTPSKELIKKAQKAQLMGAHGEWRADIPEELKTFIDSYEQLK